jgi:hypothetical protein
LRKNLAGFIPLSPDGRYLTAEEMGQLRYDLLDMQEALTRAETERDVYKKQLDEERSASPTVIQSLKQFWNNLGKTLFSFAWLAF